MKLRGGFISNSSSSSFLLFDCSKINCAEDLLLYLNFEKNMPEEMALNIDYIFRSILKFRKKTYSKKEIIQHLITALETSTSVPLFEKFFKEEYCKKYKSSAKHFSLLTSKSVKQYDEIFGLVNNETVKDFVHFMWGHMFKTILSASNTTQDILSIPPEKIDKEDFAIKYNRQNESLKYIYTILAENIYTKLEEENMLEGLVIIDVSDDDNPDVESGYYFKNTNNVVHISYY